MSQWIKQRISYDGILAILSCAINYALGPNYFISYAQYTFVELGLDDRVL
jgi:hypothetical protein